MDEETKGYMRSYMLDIGFTQSEVDELILPYYIKCDNYDGWLWQLVTGLVCLVIGIAILVIPMLAANRKKEVMFANDTPVNSNSGGMVVNDESKTFQQDSYETGNSVFENTASEKDSHSSASELGMGIAEDYKPEEGKSNLKLKM